MMSLSVLKDALLNIEPASTEAEAIVALVDAYADFAQYAEAGVLPLLPTGVALGKSAMGLALVGMNEDSAGLTKIPAGVIAFWAAVASGTALSFTGATSIVPPPHTTLAAEFAVVALANVAEERSKEEAVDAIATILYNNAIVGGVVTVVTPTYPIL